MTHKLEPRLPGEITITSDMQIIPHLWQKVPQYIRQMLTSMKGEINGNTIIVGYFNIPHSHLWIDQPNRKLARKHKL